MKKLSTSQWRMLRNIKQGRGAMWHCKTQSDYGGADSTLRSLVRLKLLTGDGTITKAGRKALLDHERALRKEIRG